MEKKKDTKMINVRINPDLWRRLRMKALSMGKTARAALEEAIAQWLERSK
ncbi:MAG: hypothetical protein WC566_05750 [Dehalococcoidia bacterium]